jgi:hemoglobin
MTQLSPTPHASETPVFDADMIERLVRTFYDKVRGDALIGPVFEARISEWEPHLRRMMAFWSAIAYGNGGYHGHPMEKHDALPVDGRHFRRWLTLFEETACEVCPPAAAMHFIDQAHRISQSFQLGIANANGILLKRGESLQRPDDEVQLP